ncbi:MAG: GntR family transcriptional regulator [Hyphomicrobiaceae bacterium]
MRSFFDGLNRQLDMITVAGIPKHVRLRGAITTLIEDGELKAGDQIAPEQQIARETGLSLGTVRKALSDLATEGVLVREHGRGTFVSFSRPAVNELHELLFVENPLDPPLPITFKLAERRLVEPDGMVKEVLGEGPACLVVRQMIVKDSIVCASRIYLSERHFPGFSDIPLFELDLNFKKFLSKRYGVITRSIEQFSRTENLDPDMCKILGCEKNSEGVVVNSIGRDTKGEIITYQVISIPPGKYYFAAPPRTVG